MKAEKIEIVLSIIILLLSAIAPNLFPIAEAGMGNLSSMALRYFIPSGILILIITGILFVIDYEDLGRQIRNGIIAGLLGTVGLEIVREIGFHFGGMPGDLPRLIGVLLLDRFASGPSLGSDITGWAYHFWTGAAFGIIFSLLFGRAKIWIGLVYGFLLGLGFMLSPVPIALGIGKLGLEFKDGYQFMLTVTLAHIAFGGILSWYIYITNKGSDNIIARIKGAFIKHKG
jgi:hypothetical protein